ncbi:hypothetical protein BDB00DRAFT_734672, partial [Zychaea mexicana]|uniref:uncharacterized protein n=1 Tax=Zychaea mexicana TaxID=64656 RepID=UPI0022FEF0C8
INNPLPSSLASECRKASRILNGFIDPGQGLDKIIPPSILAKAKGLAVFTVLKAGFLFSGRAGSGLVISRLPDGSWSAPAAIMTGGMGFGGQVGAELTDFVMVLNTAAAVKTFMHHGSITLGGNVSVAAGPIGRNAEASGAASLKSVSAVYSYSRTRGLFAGVSLEGSVIIERFDANAKMYGRKVSTRDLLNGTIPPPPQADALYRALDTRFHSHSSAGNYHSGGDGHGSGLSRSATTGRFSFMNGGNNNSRRDDFNNDSGYASNYSRSNLYESNGGGGGGGSYGGGYGSSRGFDSPSLGNTPTPPARNSNEARARAVFNFAGEQDGDLPFRKGDIITVTKKTDTQHDWWTGTLNSRTGIFPANFVE